MRPVGGIAQHDLREAVFARAGQFGPVGGVIGFGLDVIGQRGRTDHAVEPAVELQGEGILVDLLGLRQREAGRGEPETVGFELPVGAVDAQAQPLFLADLDQQRFLPLRGRPGQRFGSDLRFNEGQLEAFVEQLLAIGVDIDDAAAKQHQRQDIDEQDAAGERQAARPAQLLDPRIAFEDTAGFGHGGRPDQPSLKL